MKRSSAGWIVVLSLSCSGSSDEVTCGAGTVLVDGICSPSTKASVGTGGAPGTGSGGSTSGGAETGGEGSQAFGFDGATAASPISSTAMRLSWSAATGGGESVAYRIYLATTSGAEDYSSPSFEVLEATFADVFNLTEGATYYAVVRAVASNGTEDTNTHEVSVVLSEDASPPTFAGISSASATGPTTIKLGWDAASDDKSDPSGILYAIYVADSELVDYSTPTFVAAPGSTSAEVSMDAPNTAYWFAVRAFDAAGNGENNEAVLSATSLVDGDAPTFSGCNAAFPVGPSSVFVSWNEGSDNATSSEQLSYHVFASETPGGQDFEAAATAVVTGETSAVVTGLLPSTKFHFVCRAADGSGNLDDNLAQVAATTLSDGEDPTFAGLASLEDATASSMELHWLEATDNASPSSNIVYNIYAATAAGAQDFTMPTATTGPGDTSYAISNLSVGTTYYFVVRAQDEAGNEDDNTVELSGATLVGYSEVQAIYDQACTLCHTGATAPYGLVLDSPFFSYANTVNIPAGQRPSSDVSNPLPLNRIEPYNLEKSYIYLKIKGLQSADCPDMSCCAGGSCGSQMPLAICGGDCLPPSDEQMEKLEDWILQGAQQL